MLIFGDQEAQDSLSHLNLRAPRLIWLSVPLPVEELIKLMGKVGVHLKVKHLETHGNLTLLAYRRDHCLTPRPIKCKRAMSSLGPNSTT